MVYYSRQLPKPKKNIDKAFSLHSGYAGLLSLHSGLMFWHLSPAPPRFLHVGVLFLRRFYFFFFFFSFTLFLLFFFFFFFFLIFFFFFFCYFVYLFFLLFYSFSFFWLFLACSASLKWDFRTPPFPSSICLEPWSRCHWPVSFAIFWIKLMQCMTEDLSGSKDVI